MTRHVLGASYDHRTGQVEITTQETVSVFPGDENYASIAQDLWAMYDRENNIRHEQS